MRPDRALERLTVGGGALINLHWTRAIAQPAGVSSSRKLSTTTPADYPILPSECVAKLVLTSLGRQNTQYCKPRGQVYESKFFLRVRFEKFSTPRVKIVCNTFAPKRTCSSQPSVGGRRPSRGRFTIGNLETTVSARRSAFQNFILSRVVVLKS